MRRLLLALPLLLGCDLTPPRALGPEQASRLAEAQLLSRQAPDDAVRRGELGLLELEARRLFDAAESLEFATRRDPNNPRWRAALAGLYLELGYTRSAVDQLRGCLSVDPNQVECVIVLGSLFEGDGSVQGLREARKAWKNALTQAPNHPRAEELRNKVAQVDARLGPEVEGEGGPHGAGSQPASQPSGGHGSAAIPGHGEAEEDVGELNDFGRALQDGFAGLRDRDLVKAERSFAEASRLEPSDTVALAGLAHTKLALRKVDESKALIDKALALAPKDPQVRWIYGLFLFSTDASPEKGIQVWELILKDDPEYAKQMKLEEQISTARAALKQRQVH